MIQDYSNFTITLHDALIYDTTLLDEFTLDTTEHTAKFKEVFTAMWDIYEIGGETVPQFKRFITNRFNVNKDYYIELINAYETQINMLDGVKTTISKTTTSQGNTRETNENSSEGKEYDLPNKVVSDEDKYLSARNTDNGSSTSTSNGESSSNETTTITGNSGSPTTIKLKRDYMDMLRNVYDEFSRKFSSCFCRIYGVM